MYASWQVPPLPTRMSQGVVFFHFTPLNDPHLLRLDSEMKYPAGSALADSEQGVRLLV